jgi:hypothetical protein
MVESMPMITPQWHRARAAIPATLSRLLDLTRGAPAGMPVTAGWSVGDTLAHLVTIAAADVALIRGGTPDLPVPGIHDLFADTSVDTVALMNAEILANYLERGVAALGARLKSDVDTIVQLTAVEDPAREVAWLGGSSLPLAGLLAHLLNEFNVHAWDIARARGMVWTADPRDAALFTDVFLAGLVRCGYGKLLEHDGPVRPGRIAVTFRPGVSDPVTFVLTSGRMSLDPLERRPDAVVSYDPVTFNLMLFGRVSRLRAAVTGKVRIGGRRPWLLPEFMRTMRVPS